MLNSSNSQPINQSISGNNNQMAGHDINTEKTDRQLIDDLKKQLDNKENTINTLLKQQELLINQLNILTSKLA